MPKKAKPKSDEELLHYIRDLGYHFAPGGKGKRYIVLRSSNGKRTRGTGLKNDEEGWKKAKEIEAKVKQQGEVIQEVEKDEEEAKDKPKEPNANTIVEAALSLPIKPKPATPEANVATTDAIKPSLEIAAHEYNLMLLLGKMVRYELQGDVKLSEEELKNPEQAARKYFAFIQTLLKLREDAKAYDRLMAENVVARAAIKELKTAVLQLKEFSDAAWYSMCEPCRKKAMYVLAMKSARAKEVITP